VWIRAALLALAVAAGGCGDEPETEVLVFSRTTAYRHADAIEAGRDALKDRFAATVTEDPAAFEDLGGVDVVVLLHTNGPGVLRGGQRAAFERWVRAGGGVVAIHAAANADRDWAYYGELLGGARFRDHRPGPLQREDVVVEDAAHPATAGLPARWSREDEWYRFAPEPGPAAHVLATVDGDPMVWATQLDRGRALYSALGHAGAAWSEPRYREHVFAAVEWAASRR
jgi:type 1 glutamine amidotransferase